MDSVSGDAIVESPPRPRRWRSPAAVLVVVAALGASFVWWGRPRLGDGGLAGPGNGMTWTGDGVAETRMLVRGRPADTVTATFSISNDGHVPFTVYGLDVAGMGYEWLGSQRVTFMPGLEGMVPDSAPAGQVTLRPGTQATVFWSIEMSCPPRLSAGNSTTIPALAFKVSWLGVPTVRELPLARPITFVGDPARGSGRDCAGLPR